MENENIISSGQQINDVYFILDGEVEIMDYNSPGNEYNKLKGGQYFGGIVQNIIQLHDIKATKITKVAILEQNNFIQFIEAYPEWYNSIAKYEKVHKLMKNFMTRLKGVINQRKKKQLNAFNLLKRALTSNLFKRQNTTSPTLKQSISRSQYNSPNKQVYISIKNSPKPEPVNEFPKEIINTNIDTTQRNILGPDFLDVTPTSKKQFVPTQNNQVIDKEEPKEDSPNEKFVLKKDEFLFELQSLRRSKTEGKLRTRKSLPDVLNAMSDEKEQKAVKEKKTPPKMDIITEKESPKGKSNSFM